MKIGLIRHFKVKIDKPNKILISQNELFELFKAYDSSDVEIKEIESSENWEKCYSSDLYRAVKTAEKCFKGEIVKTSQLRELEPMRIFKNNIKLPLLVWIMLIRIFQLTIPNELTKSFEIRIEKFLDEILAEENGNILIVSHGITMIFLQKKLINRGFKGKRFRHPKNGEIYEYSINEMNL